MTLLVFALALTPAAELAAAVQPTPISNPRARYDVVVADITRTS